MSRLGFWATPCLQPCVSPRSHRVSHPDQRQTLDLTPSRKCFTRDTFGASQGLLPLTHSFFLTYNLVKLHGLRNIRNNFVEDTKTEKNVHVLEKHHFIALSI